MPDIDKIPKHIENAIVDTFRIQLKSSARVVSLTMDPELISSKRKSIDCLSTVGLQSSTLVGQLGIALPKATCLNILERLLGEKPADLTLDNSDAVSEILNIVFSSSRRPINECGFDFKLAIPATVIGCDFAVTRSGLNGYSLFFECHSDLGDFLVLLALKPIAIETAS
jgi:chemotaxis protein CheX